MSHAPATEADRRAIRGFLDDVVFDLMPSEGFEEAMAGLPDGATVAVTLVPKLGVEPTVERTEQAVARGHDAVSHVAPRFIEDALEEMGYSFEDVGITGYPTGHESIDDATLVEAMNRKAPHATYIATQLTLEPGKIVDWIAGVRDRGVDLPVEVGVPGVMTYLQLLRLSWAWGVADPLRFVRKTVGVVGFLRKLLESGGRYEPDDMVAELAPYHDDEPYDFRRTRLLTFNQTAETESWRRARLGE